MDSMSELSIFVDESGDFGETNNSEDNYLVTFVFHDQDDFITKYVDYLENSLINDGFNIDYIHTGPIIRREDVFKNYTLDERRTLLYRILNFTIRCPIKHATVVVNREKAPSAQRLAGKISRGIAEMIQEHKDFFSKYEKIKVYYDNGQHELSVILSAIFSSHFENVDFKSAEQKKYRLLQSADFICSMELLRIKKKENRLSKSETGFFYKSQELNKTFLKGIDKLRL